MTVKVRKKGKEERTGIMFKDLEVGDTVFIKGRPIPLLNAPHLNLDDEYLFYDVSGEAIFDVDLDLYVSKKLETVEGLINWANNHPNILGVFGFGSYFSETKVPSDIDLVVVMDKNCGKCIYSVDCLGDELMEEFQETVHEQCPYGYRYLMDYAKNRTVSDLPLDLKVVGSEFLTRLHLDVVTSITNEGMSLWTMCGAGFFNDVKLLFRKKWKSNGSSRYLEMFLDGELQFNVEDIKQFEFLNKRCKAYGLNMAKYSPSNPVIGISEYEDLEMGSWIKPPLDVPILPIVVLQR